MLLSQPAIVATAEVSTPPATAALTAGHADILCWCGCREGDDVYMAWQPLTRWVVRTHLKRMHDTSKDTLAERVHRFRVVDHDCHNASCMREREGGKVGEVS
jgi:hypothetical protein